METRILRASLAATLLAASLPASSLLIGDYDPRAGVGTLLTPAPGEGLTRVAARPGRYVAEVEDLEVEGRRAALVLWAASPRDPTRYPELWVVDPGERLRQAWPDHPDFAWVDPEYRVLTDPAAPGVPRLHLTRAVPVPGEEAASTRELLRVTPTGLVLEEKEPGPWGSARQLRALLADCIASGSPSLVRPLLAAEQARQGALDAGLLAAVARMLRRHAEGLGVDLGPGEAR